MNRLLYPTLVLALACPSLAAAQGYDRDPAECAQMSTDEVVVVPYTIQEGDSCARIARRQYGDRSRYDLIHAYNPGMGPEPHRHTAGNHLCLPREAPARGSGPAARVTALRPNVRSQPSQQAEWEPTAVRDPIDRGTRVNTLERAFAELTFSDTTIVTLRGDTLVVVYGETSGAVRRTGTEAVLERGALRSRLGDLRANHRLHVRTPASQVELHGGSAVATVDAESTTRVSNHEGGEAMVNDANGRRGVRVRPGMGSAVRQGAAPSPPQPLPPAPTWAADQPRRFVGVPSLTTIRGRWAAVPDARVYRVEIARLADGRDLVAQVEVPASVTSFEIHRLPPGTYYARLATIDQDFFESAPSDPVELEVSVGALRAPGAEPTREATFDFGDASEEVGPVVVAPGTVFTAPEGTTCGRDASSLARETTLSGAGDLALICRAGDEALGGVRVVVAEVTLASAEGDASEVTAVRGRETSVELTIRSGAALPTDLTLRGSDGVEVRGLERDGDRLRATLRVAEDAPEPAQLTLVAGEDAVLGAAPLSLATADQPAAPPDDEEEPERPRRPLWSQSFGTTLLPSTVGIRDLDRDHVGAWISMGYFGEGDGVGERARGSAGARGAFLDRQLQVELAAAGDFVGTHDRTAQRGSGDLYGAVGYRPAIDDDAFGLVAEVGAFFPTQPDDSGLGAVRLVPSVHISWQLDTPVLLRTRQGMVVDLDTSRNAAWVSAYALDYRPLEPLTIGAEIDFTLGEEDGDLLLLPLAGVTASLGAGPVVFGMGVRFGLTEEAHRTYGVWSAHATLELGLWNEL